MNHILKSRFNLTKISIGILAITMLVLGMLPLRNAHALTPAFVQTNYREVNSGTTDSVAFNSANGAGNLIVAFVIWSSATSTASITDSRGNTYASTAAATKWNGSKWSSQIFYAKNIAGGANTVTATFNSAITQFGVVYIHEYSGIDTVNPLDNKATAIGTSKAMSSGSATTTNANDLIFGAGASNGSVTTPGAGFSTRSTGSGNMTEDKIVTVAGSNSATATQNSTAWVMNMVAFKAGSTVTDTTPPSVPSGLNATPQSSSQINLGWTASTDNIGVTGYKIFRNGTQVGTSSTTTYNDTGLTQGTSYTYAVAATDAAGNTSAQSSTVTATTPVPPPDTTAPSVPANLAGTAGTNQVNLTWSASTDNVGVTGYKVYRDGTLISSPTATSYQDTGLSPSTTYTYNVSAYDAAGNTSAQSSAASITTTTPAAFSYPVSTANRKFYDQNGQVYVLKTMSSWALAQNGTDAEITSALEGLKNLGFNAVTVNPNGNYYGNGWDRYHNIAGQPFFTGTPFASPLGSGWSSMDRVVSEATRLQMSVVFSFYTGNFNDQGMGNDLIAAGNTNAYNYGKNVATRYAQYPNIIWHIGADYAWNYGQNPAPMMENIMKGIFEIEGTTHRLKLAEPVNGQSSYDQFISQEGSAGSGYQYLRLNANSVYSYGDNSVDDFDSRYNEAGATTYPVWDCEPPYVNAPHYAGNKDQQQRERNYSTFIRGGIGINFGHEKWWPTGKDGIYDGGPGWLNVLSQAPQLQAGYAWNLVDTYMKDSTWKPDNATFLKTGLGSGDTKAASGYSQTAAVAYFPSSRSVVVNTTAVPGSTPLRLRWLDPATGTYTTIADGEVRNANRTVSYPANHSDGSSDWVLVVDLSSVNDTQAPSVPTNVTATGVSSTQINVAWSASTDNIAVNGYKVLRDGVQIGTTTTTNYSDTNLSAGTTYNYTVVAYDYANNQSAPSSGVTGTTLPPDTTPPSAPTNLAVGTVTGTSVALSWTASTDNIGVSGYSVYRNGTLAGVVNQTQFVDTGLLPSTTYNYYVIAGDSAGNPSGQSNTVTATTSANVTYATPAFVQINSATPQTNQSTVNVSYNNAQVAGNTNIIAVGWNDSTSTINSVTDNKGNIYLLAAPIARSQGVSQAIYYAKNINASTNNTVTVVFNTAVPYADIRISEYSGLDKQNPFDVTASSFGTASSASSGSAQTTATNELIYGAGITTGGFSATPVNGFTTRIITSPDLDIVIDKNVTTAGSYSATATQSGTWVMQMATFKAAVL